MFVPAVRNGMQRKRPRSGRRLDSFQAIVSKIEVEGGAGCWVWRRAASQVGYGQLTFNGQHYDAHVFAWIEFNGFRPPPGYDVCHSCDNRRCVNPNHLFLGTRRDNIRDMHAKGRGVYGVRHHRAKLTSEQVAEVRRLYAAGGESHSSLARRFGVSATGIGVIVKGKVRNHG